MMNPQQYRLKEVRSGREFLAHRSRMRKTTLEQLAEDGRRTVPLRPGLPLEDAMDSTVMEEPTQQEDQVKETRDEILNEPRRSEAERAPEPVTEILNGTESHVRVLDWLYQMLRAQRRKRMNGERSRRRLRRRWKRRLLQCC